jgi:hypothetical protein
VHVARSPGQGFTHDLRTLFAPMTPCSFASTSSSTSIRASPLFVHWTSHPVKARVSEQRHVVPTFPAHILSLSKTSSFFCVSCRYRVRDSAHAFCSPMECPVSRRAHPASAGLFVMRTSVVFSFPHPRNRTSDAPSLPRPPRSLQTLPPVPSSSLPPRLRVRRAVCPEQGRLPPTGLSERRATSHPGLAFRPE